MKFDKKGLGYVLGDIFTNSSGRPAQRGELRALKGQASAGAEKEMEEQTSVTTWKKNFTIWVPTFQTSRLKVGTFEK
jgi:hypothetical protein